MLLSYFTKHPELTRKVALVPEKKAPLQFGPNAITSNFEKKVHDDLTSTSFADFKLLSHD